MRIYQVNATDSIRQVMRMVFSPAILPGIHRSSFQVGDCLPRVELADGPWLLGKIDHNDFALVTGPGGAAWREAAENQGVTVLVEDLDFEPLQPLYERADLQPNGALLIRPDGHICARWTGLPESTATSLGTALTGAVSGDLNTNGEGH